MKKIWKILSISLFILVLLSSVSAASAKGGEKVTMPTFQFMGELNYTAGNVSGRFISFHIDEKSGEIEDYRVNNVTVFKSIEYENDTIGKVNVHGAVLTYKGTRMEVNKKEGFNMEWRFIAVHDNPSGVLHILTHGSDVITYELGEDITCRVGNTSHYEMVYLNGSVVGKLMVVNGEVSVENRSIEIKTATNSTTSVIFIDTAHVVFPKHIKKEIMMGIEKGKVGAQLYISQRGTDFVNYTHEIKMQVKLREKNRVRVEISSEDPQGKAVMIMLEKELMELNKNRTLKVLLDGNEITKADFNEVMNGTDSPMYAMVEENNTMYILVYIPHFSTHTLDIETQSIAENGNTAGGETEGASEKRVPPMIWGIIAGVVIIGVIVGAIIKSR